VPVSAFERVKNVPPQGTQFWNRRVIEIAAVDHSDLFHDSPRTGVRLHGECDQGVKAELAKTKLQRCKRAFGGQSLTPKTRNEAVQEFDSWRERHVEWYPFQTQNTGKVASHIKRPWSIGSGDDAFLGFTPRPASSAGPYGPRGCGLLAFHKLIEESSTHHPLQG
jgi:hypothetical protein